MSPRIPTGEGRGALNVPRPPKRPVLSGRGKGAPGHARHIQKPSPVAPACPQIDQSAEDARMVYLREKQAATDRLNAKQAPLWESIRALWKQMQDETARDKKGGRPKSKGRIPLFTEARNA